MKILKSAGTAILLWCTFIMLYVLTVFLINPSIDIQQIPPALIYTIGMLAGVICGIWSTLIFKKEK